MKLVVNLDFQKLQAQNMVLHPLASAPGTPTTGQSYFDTALNAPRWYDGGAWTNKATDSLLLGGSALSAVLSRANHTGTQLASTISDLATAVQAYRLDQFAVPTADLSLNSHKLTNVTDPSNPQDAATKNYVDTQMINSAAGIDAKPSVRVASTANQALSGGTAFPTIDGVVTALNDRVLLKNQTTGSQNGPYVVGGTGTAWTLTRAVDADATGEITPGAFWYVEEGTANGKTQWRVENTGTITLGTTSITINQFGGSGATYTGSNGILLTANNFTAVADPAAGGGIAVTSAGIKVDTAVVARKYSTDIGNGSLTTITVTHNLGTKDVITTVRLNSDDSVVLADVINATTNTVTVTFATAPATNAYRVTVIG
jgi:hypothetical protein